MLTILQKPEQTKYMYMFNKEGQFFFLFRIPDNGTEKNKILDHLLQSYYD